MLPVSFSWLGRIYLASDSRTDSHLAFDSHLDLDQGPRVVIPLVITCVPYIDILLIIQSSYFQLALQLLPQTCPPSRWMTRRPSLPKQHIPEVVAWMKNYARGYRRCSERSPMMISLREARPLAVLVAFLAQYSLSSTIVFFLCSHTIYSSTLTHIVHLQVMIRLLARGGKAKPFAA